MKMFSNVKKELVIVIAILGFGSLAMSILQPILPLYLTDIGVNPEILGLMFSVAMLGMVFGESSAGWLADKIGLAFPLSIGTFVCGPIVLGFILTQDVPIIFTIFFLWGVIRSTIWGPGRGYVAANAPPLKKATFMAIFTAILAASRSLGALPSGFIVDNWGYNWVFFISCGISLMSGILVIAGLRKSRMVEPEVLTVTPSPTDELHTGQRFSYGPVIYQSIVAFLNCIGWGISLAFLPLLATQVMEMSATQVGVLFTIQGIISMVLSIPMGMLADRRGRKVFMILGLLVAGLAMAGIAYAQSFSWLIICGSISALGWAMFGPAAVALLSDSVPLKWQGTAMGVYGAVGENTGIIAGSALGGFIWSAWGPRVTFLFGTVAAVLAAVVCFTLVGERSFKKSL